MISGYGYSADVATSTDPDEYEFLIKEIYFQYDDNEEWILVWSGNETVDVAGVSEGERAGIVTSNESLSDFGIYITAVKINYYDPSAFTASMDYSGTTYYTPSADEAQPSFVVPAKTTPPAESFAGAPNHRGDETITWANLNILVEENTNLQLRIPPQITLYDTQGSSPYFFVDSIFWGDITLNGEEPIDGE